MQITDFKLSTGAWVVVANGEKALILENRGTIAHPDLAVVRRMQQDNPPNREQGTDAPGRLYDGGPNQRSAVGETDWHRLAQDRFAKDAAALLYAQMNANRFREVVLVAAPRILGELRKELHPEVADRVIGELPKDLTSHPVEMTEKHLLG